MKQLYSMVITAKNMFDSLSEKVEEGYLCIQGNIIAKVGKGKPNANDLAEAEQIFSFDEELVMPGIIDTHTFFTGYAIFHVGADISNVTDNESGMKVIRSYLYQKNPKGALLGHGWNPEVWRKEQGTKMLEEYFADKPVILFSDDRSTCMMNQLAKETYQFSPESCYPESYYRIMREYLNDREFIEAEFKDYMDLMNSRGVTTVKEMGFDDYYGFTDFLKEMENSKALHLRTFFMSQPVGERMNLEYAKRMRELFTGNTVRFSGFNCMTDGTIADYRGDLKVPYENTDFTCSITIPYKQIEEDVLAADAEGFRYSLHAQGDGAVAKIADIYDKCKKSDGKLINRHAVTDMEFTDPKDLERLGKMGVNAELYFQIMSLDSGAVLKDNIQKTIGSERKKYYWNRRKMADVGMNLCGATDLPLMITNVSESIYYSCGGYLNGEEEPFQPENTITIAEMLKAWTIGGQKNIGMEQYLGTLEEGKLADIAVFDRNLLDINPKSAKEASVVMTIMNGNIVYNRT